MKEIKAYVHRNRIADVIAALKGSSAWAVAGNGGHNLTAYIVKGSLLPVEEGERHYSLELGDEIINEYKLELLCSDEHVQGLVDIIRSAGRTGLTNSGWITVAHVEQALPIL